MKPEHDQHYQEARFEHPSVRSVTVAVKWQQKADQWQLILASNHPCDEVILAEVFENNKAFPSARWRWICMGSTWAASDAQTAMKHVESRLRFPSHEEWCAFAESVGIHPPQTVQ